VNEWIKINSEKDNIPKIPFLLADKWGHISIGLTAFDYYDSEYWFPIPKLPFSDATITNDNWVNLSKNKKNCSN